jgi:guanylate kinase
MRLGDGSEMNTINGRMQDQEIQAEQELDEIINNQDVFHHYQDISQHSTSKDILIPTHA